MKKWLSLHTPSKNKLKSQIHQIIKTCMANLNSGNWKRFTPDKENLFVPGACLLHFERNITPCVNKYTALPEFFFLETCTNYFSFCRDLQIRYEYRYYIRKIKVKNSNTIHPSISLCVYFTNIYELYNVNACCFCFSSK